MNLTPYLDHEVEFLKAMATRFGMTGKNRIIFVERFRQRNADSDHKVIAECYKTELLEGTSTDDAPRIFRQQLKSICDKLEAYGCKFTKQDNRDKWLIALEWLQTVHYPEWAKEHLIVPRTCDELWGQLWGKATPTNTLKLVLPKPVGTLDMGGDEVVDDEQLCVPLGSKVYVQVQLEQAGYLLLLEKGTSGKIWCLSPSGGFAPNPYLNAGVERLPQLGARNRCFTLKGLPGKEEVVAVIAKKQPSLDWLPQPSASLLQLDAGHLTGLLRYLQDKQDCQVLCMAYQVTA